MVSGLQAAAVGFDVEAWFTGLDARVRALVVNRHVSRLGFWVGRPTFFGNPWTHERLESTRALYQVATREEVVGTYLLWLVGLVRKPELEPKRQQILRALRSGGLHGKRLVCVCTPRLCHAHVLAWLANLDGEDVDWLLAHPAEWLASTKQSSARWTPDHELEAVGNLPF